MFSDVSEDSVHADDINCIAAYGITVGMGDGTYGPGAYVTAFEMGLFVQRAADLMGADGEAVLSGVMLSDHVTRLEMAQLMFGLVDDIDGDVRVNPADGQIQFRGDDNAWVVVNDFFADAKAQVPIFESQVVGAVYELGITRGTKGDGTLVSTPDSTFEPSATVTRAQMASFIARTLDHSNLRPEGLSFQRNKNKESMVSLRDGDFAPVEDARIDVLSSLYPDDAFDDKGECVLRFLKDETPSHSVCAIDIGDQQTDDEGNVEFTLVSDSDPVKVDCATGSYTFTSAEGSTGRTFWAWTGELGDKVDADTHLQKLENVARPVGTAGPDYANVSGGLPSGDELAKMGETVEFKLQLHSQTGATPDPTKDPAVGPDRSRNPYTLTVAKYVVTRVDGTDSDHGRDESETETGTASVEGGMFEEAPGDWDLGSRIGTPVDTVVWPNSDGEYIISLNHLDPVASADSPDVGVHFTLKPFTARNDRIQMNLVTNLIAGANFADDANDEVTGYVIFSDEAPDPHKVTAETLSYRIIEGSATGNSVTVKVVDQYGDPMRNVAVSVNSDLDLVAPSGTDPDEVTYPEEVDITVQDNEDGDGDTTDDDPDAGEAGETDLFDRTASRDSYFTLAAGTLTAPGTPADGTRSTIELNDKRAINRNPTSVGQDDVEGEFKTRRGGTYRVGYSYTGRTAQTETILAESIEVRTLGINDNDTPNNHTDDSADVTTSSEQEVGAAAMVYWALIGINAQSDTTAGGDPEAVPVLVPDVPNRTIVVNEPLEDEAGKSPRDADGDNPRAYFYDEDDTYEINGQGATFEMFEEALKLSRDADGCAVSTIEWENYYRSRPGRVNRTIWRLGVT